MGQVLHGCARTTAIDRTSKFAFARLVERATRREAADFLQELIGFIPYKIHTVLTDNGIHFTTPGNVRSAATDIKLAWERGEHFRAHSFQVACARHDIDHRLTKPNHPWTNGQVERMNRTIKEATVRTYHYDEHAQLREHLAAFRLQLFFRSLLTNGDHRLDLKLFWNVELSPGFVVVQTLHPVRDVAFG